MKYIAHFRWVLIVFACTVGLNCEVADDNDYGIRDLYRYAHHEHALTFYVKTINHASDTSGITSAHWRPRRWTFWGSRGRQGYYDVDVPITIEIVQPDTDFHAYPTTITHFAGYQLRHDGDTMRLSAMEGGQDWWVSLACDVDTAWTEYGDAVRLMDSGLGNVPDTVRTGHPTEVEVVFDLDGLFSVDSTTHDVRIRSGKIQVRQR